MSSSKGSNQSFFQNGLQFLEECPVCQQTYSQDKARVVEKRGNLRLLHAECESCGSSVMMLVLGSRTGMVTTVGMLTDLTSKDLDRLQKHKKVSVDDVLDLHQCFKTSYAD